MVLEFEKETRMFVPDLNNIAQLGRRSVRSGCLVAEKGTPDMSVDVASGVVLFDSSFVTVASTNVAIATSDPSYDRVDLVVVSNVGVVSVLTGTTDPINNKPKSPDYDPDDYVVLARVFVDDGVTTILDAAITDLRIIIETIYGISRYDEGFTSTSSVAVNHALNDDKPMVMVYDNQASPQLIEPDSIVVNDANNITVTFTSSETGTVVVYGGTGGLVGQAASYIHVESPASTTWNVNHNLGQKYVIVQVYDSSDNWVIPSSISLTDDNNLVITLSSSITGRAVIQAGQTAPVLTRYLHTEAAPATTWNVNHGLNEKYVTAMVYDGSDNWIIPNSINLVDANNLTITLSSSIAGKAVVLK